MTRVRVMCSASGLRDSVMIPQPHITFSFWSRAQVVNRRSRDQLDGLTRGISSLPEREDRGGVWDNISRQHAQAGVSSHHTVHTSCPVFTARVHTSATLFTLVFTLTFHTLATANPLCVALGRPRVTPKHPIRCLGRSHARPRGHYTCSFDRSDTPVLAHTSSTSVSNRNLPFVGILLFGSLSGHSHPVDPFWTPDCEHRTTNRS